MNPACIQSDFSYLYISLDFGQETMVTSPVYATVIHVFALHVCLPPERVEINQNKPGMFNKRDFNRSVYCEHMVGISSFTPRFLPWGQSLYLVISLIEYHFESQWRRRLQIKKIYILKLVPVHSLYYMNLPVYFTKVHKTQQDLYKSKFCILYNFLCRFRPINQPQYPGLFVGNPFPNLNNNRTS